jgi:hypothetical protein
MNSSIERTAIQAGWIALDMPTHRQGLRHACFFAHPSVAILSDEERYKEGAAFLKRSLSHEVRACGWGEMLMLQMWRELSMRRKRNELIVKNYKAASGPEYEWWRRPMGLLSQGVGYG